jgi:hypothetical protein
MDRRGFVKGSMLTLGGALLASHPRGAWAEAPHNEKQALPPIDYPNKNIPAFEVPPYVGERYEDTIPDTLDLAHRIELAINALTGITDPSAEYEVYWQTELFRNPAVMMHDHNDWVQSVEGFMEALPLLRVATGSSLNAQVDPVWMQVLLKSIGADGLIYEILDGRPWSRLNPWSFEFVWMPDGTNAKTGDVPVALATTSAKCGRILGTMAAYYLRDKNPLWRKTSERMIERLAEMVVDRGSFAYIPHGAFAPNAKFGRDARMPTGYDAVDYGNIRMIQGLAQYYRATGYEPAIRLAAKLTAFGMGPAEYYDAQGRFLVSANEIDALLNSPRLKIHYPEARDLKYGGHFHNHTIGLLSMLEYAVVAQDRKTLEFVNSGYRWAKTQGSSLVGFFPELAIDNKYFACESCEVADMIAIALKLTDGGAGDYYDDVDRWVRNQFAEQQLTNGGWIHELEKTQPRRPVAFNETADRLVERNIGTFAGWSSGNEFASQIGIQQCCLGNSARALYYVWDRIVQRKGGELRVNLLLNRASKWADVYSYIPYEGRMELKIKQPASNVLVRMPEWINANSRDVLCEVNGTFRSSRWDGRYVNFGEGRLGDVMSVTFPIHTRTVEETIGNVLYTLALRGSTVIAIDPPGKVGPLYNRAYYSTPKAPMRNTQRFISSEEIHW